MSAQPEALRIATRAERMFKVLEGNETVPTMRVMEFMLEAAAELRRLHAENEAPREDLRKFREAASCERDLRQEQGRHAAALVQQMLEAGKELNRFYSHIWDRVDGCAVIFPDSIPAFENAVEKHGEAITAASEWLGQKGETK